ncbi:hypothetical protein Bccel_2758 [Pseudobacteroides cellulosolvens ATCC 35603 = DSM 2933]|uniref:Uncharacterized protein n=1 Tax=Pseudobacteroides cellulosolvens ATCC 35603 = DSM 2933 TaxID=398512 RepID=A0A0L6JQ31_9FIRM|nr:hypothetical protein Bccel_2758 [Pseudobacteroides cellulosolvens ATCC 35603 = DSM 2933]
MHKQKIKVTCFQLKNWRQVTFYFIIKSMACNNYAAVVGVAAAVVGVGVGVFTGVLVGA